MRVLQITSVKDFMNKLLITDLFDHFLLSEASIQGLVTYVIDGHMNKGFLSEDELNENQLTGLSCVPFSKLRSECFQIIKGKNAPVAFRFIFMLSPENMDRTFGTPGSGTPADNLNTVFMNIRFQDCTLTCTSGISYKTFSMDRSFEQIWDTLVMKFFDKHEISYTELS